MRLIFDKEREFLNKELGINIPSERAFMNRMCVKVLDNKDKWHTMYRIKVEGENLSLTGNNEDKMSKLVTKDWNEIIEDNKERLLELEEKALKIISEYRDRFEGYTYSVPVSGGKDSAIVHYLVNQVIDNEETIFSNTTNETHHTYKYIKENYPDARIITPEEGFYPLIKRTGTVPSKFSRLCCTLQKEMPMISQLERESKRLFFMGMRKAESSKRAAYETEWKNHRWGDRAWLAILPILEWTDMDVILYMLFRNIPFNYVYNFSGRCGCTFCPYRTDYELLTAKEFLRPYYDRWQSVLEEDFISNKKSPSINCSLKEYKEGAWRSGMVRDNATEEIVEEFAKLQGLDIKVAEKYFDKRCMCCDKKIKKNDVALSLKFYGRNIENFKCLKCIGEEFKVSTKELKERIKQFKNGGCDLF